MIQEAQSLAKRLTYGGHPGTFVKSRQGTGFSEGPETFGVASHRKDIRLLTGFYIRELLCIHDSCPSASLKSCVLGDALSSGYFSVSGCNGAGGGWNLAKAQCPQLQDQVWAGWGSWRSGRPPSVSRGPFMSPSPSGELQGVTG